MMREWKKPREQLLLAAVSTAVIKLCSPSIDNGANAKDFASLCGIYNLKHSTLPLPPAHTFVDVDNLIDSFYNYNLSTAANDFYDRKGNAFDSITDSASKAKQIQSWKDEVTKRTKLKTDDGQPSEHARLPDKAMRANVNSQISSLHATAVSYREEYAKAVQAVADAAKLARGKVLSAIYGKANQAYDQKTAPATKAAMCGSGTAGSGNVGKNVINNMICLCTVHGGGLEKTCGEKTFPDVSTTPKSTAAAAAAKLEAACTAKESKQTLTAALKQAKISNFLDLIGSNPNSQTDASVRFVLGKATSSGCEGSSQKECVNYKTQLQSGGKGIPWVVELEAAAQILAAAGDQYNKAIAIENELKVLKRAAANLYLSAKTGLQSKETSTSIATSAGGTGSGKEEECNKRDYCGYETENTDEKKCKYNKTKADKSEVSVTQTQTTGGTETTTEKCKGKKKDDCKDRDCKWENDACKDSSYLVHYKLSLSMGAAFREFCSILRVLKDFI
uniref:Variant surface glycoprotein 1125.4167 n=1 Tax=Trypanosoma brucei TaxID=5691 RepID=A0A1J0RAF3_9TRYP|nr:variant surface glycoprotein 1125.4167 [Trypanosoma brucei]